jgi:hypothetical protein
MEEGKGASAMNQIEIRTFIESMEEMGDIWTEEQVNRVYGGSTLEESLLDRRTQMHMHLNNLAALLNAEKE